MSKNINLKRSSLIIMCLIGLVVLEYGCKKDPATSPGCHPSSQQKVVGISNPVLLKWTENYYTETDASEPVAYDSLIIRMACQTEELTSTRTSSTNSGLYALRIAYPSICWELKSVNIMGEINGQNVDLTNHFRMHIGGGSYSEYYPITNDKVFQDEVADKLTYWGNFLNFKMETQPDVLGEYSFTITYRNWDNTSYQVVTDKVVIE